VPDAKEDSMAKDLIEVALGTATDTKAIVSGIDVLDQTGRVFTECFPGQRAILVADENTWAAAGEPAKASLQATGIEMDEPYVFPGKPTLYAGYENVENLREHLRRTDAIACSIASGTLNDIAKLASGELGRPYMNVCTAASMDGYAAFGASITRDGFKITRNCPAPAGLVADLRVMARAPKRLTATGFGDLIEKVPAGADWIIADELGVEPIDDYVWGLVQGSLRDALSDPAGLAAGNPDSIKGLAEGLIMSGLAMQAHQSSRPASGAGHNFSHQWEMEGHGLDWEPPLSHGFKVGLGTVSISALYDRVLLRDLSTIDTDAVAGNWLTPEQNEQRVRALHEIPALADAAVAQSMAKYVPIEEAAGRVELIKTKWPRIKERISPQLLPATEIRDAIKTVGGIYHPSQIDISWEHLKETYFLAETIRSRYTVLDMLREVGLLAEIIDEVFGPEGYWAQNREA
jgi:glycerol-1-phosphate dehydrogenase [NAD(P)+]